MSKQARITAKEAERLLLESNFKFIRQKGSHKIYIKKERRVVVPFHSGKILHPKIVKQILKAIEETKDLQ